MADKNLGNILLGIKAKLDGFDDAGSKLAKFGLAIDGLKKGAQLLSAPMSKLIDISKQSLTEYSKQEKSIIALNTALKNQGNYSDETSQSLQSLASSLQSVTTYGDDVTLSAAATLQAMSGIGKEAMTSTIPAIQDFATAMGMDLESAAQLVGKSIGSSTNALSRYGIEISNTTDKNQRAAEITAALTQRFGGLSQAMAQTSTGGFEQLRNIIGDIQENFGKFIDSVLNAGVLDYVRAVALTFQELTGNLGDNETAAVNMSNGIVAGMRVIINVAGKVYQGFVAFQLLWKMLQIGFVTLTAGIVNGLLKVAQVIDRIFKTDTSSGLQAFLDGANEQLSELNDEAIQLGQNFLTAGENAKLFGIKVEETYTKLQNQRKSMANISSTTPIESTSSSVEGVIETTTSDNTTALNSNTDMLNNVFSATQSLVQTLMDSNKSMGEKLQSMVATILPIIGAVVGSLIAPGAGTTIGAMIGSTLGQVVQGFATGGIINEPVLLTSMRTGRVAGMAGEAGKEAITPLNGQNYGGNTIIINSPILGSAGQYGSFMRSAGRKAGIYDSYLAKGAVAI